jgi:phosphate-selective porin
MLHGRVLKRSLRYEAGLFRRDARSVAGPDGAAGGPTTAVRITATPFAGVRSALADVQAGVALTHADLRAGLAQMRGRTALGERFMPSAFWVAGTRRRSGLELRWRPGPFSIGAEYMRLTDERTAQGVDGSDLPALEGTGWYVSGTWVATGEPKRRLDDGPRAPLFAGGVGSVELAARVEELAFGSRSQAGPASTDPRARHVARRAAHALTLGVNWRPHRHVKVQANLVRDRGSSEGAAGHAAWGRAIRVQFSR